MRKVRAARQKSSTGYYRYYLIQDVLKDGKRTSETVQKLGSEQEIAEFFDGDPMDYARQKADEENARRASEDNPEGYVYLKINPGYEVEPGTQVLYNIGYLPLEKIYYELGMPSICRKIQKARHFQFDLDEVLSRLIYTQVLFPTSKLGVMREAKQFLEPFSFEYQHVLRALDVLDDNFYEIQGAIFKNSRYVVDRKLGVIFYDCTNIFFHIHVNDPDLVPTPEEMKRIIAIVDKDDRAEVEQMYEGLRKKGFSKEHRPFPIVQIGLAMDRSGIPLAVVVVPGSTNEQCTLRRIEKKIQTYLGIHKFLVCTDAGLSSEENQKYNNFGGRAFITTVQVRKQSAERTKWMLSPDGWKLAPLPSDISSASPEPGNAPGLKKEELTDAINKKKGLFNLDALFHSPDEKKNEERRSRYFNRIFYKEEVIEGYDKERDIQFNRTLIVTYSVKYARFQKLKREDKLNQARRALASGKLAARSSGDSDYRRYIKAESKDGSAASYGLDIDQIKADEKFDGFYAMMHNIPDAEPYQITAIAKGRWEIEESFRIMKHSLEIRPVYVSLPEHIRGHILVCFIALTVFRILEKELNERFTADDLFEALRRMFLSIYPGQEQRIYHGAYTPDDVTMALDEYTGFSTRGAYITDWVMRGNLRVIHGKSKREQVMQEQRKKRKERREKVRQEKQKAEKDAD